MILTQNKPSANSKLKATKELSANKPRATKKPRAIFGFRAIMPSTIQRPKAINSNSNTKRIDLKQDLQITNSLNKQQSINLNKLVLRLRRTLRLIFKV